MGDYSYLGKSPPRPDALEKVTGKALYGGDIRLPGLLVAKVLRSPHPHARILDINISQARRLAGVKAVITVQDAPEVKFGRWIKDRDVLARGVVRFAGEAVAAVAAEDADTAEEALSLIKVEYEPLPAVFDPFEAMAEGAPLVHEGLASYAHDRPRPNPRGNILDQMRLGRGKVEEGLARADFVLEERYSTQAVHPGFLQPHEAVASIDPSGRLTLWTSTKGVFGVKEMLAEALALPPGRVRAIGAVVGGDFGGKGAAYIEPVCALLALKSGRPVRLCLTRQEELTATFLREPAFMELKLGAKKDGTFTALKASLVLDLGAYTDSMGHLRGATMTLSGPYRIPDLDFQGYAVYTHNSPTGHVRAPRIPSAIFAIESHVDRMARALKIDPVEIRLRNALEDGDTLLDGSILRNTGLKESLRRVSDYLKGQGKGESQGWGVACGQWSLWPIRTEGEASACTLKVNEDGSVALLTGVAEQGAGQLALLTQIVAEELKVPPEQVTVVAADTDITPYEMGSGGSRTTYRVGNTVRMAAEEVRAKLLRLAAERLEARPEDLELAEGGVRLRHAPHISLSLRELARFSLTSRQGPIIATGEAFREERMARMREAVGSIDAPHFTAHAVKVEVDRGTGGVKVLKYFAVHDVGFAINPQNVEGQIQGGIVYGLGYALSEEVVSKEGRVLNPSLLDYRQPTTLNVPPIEFSLVKVPSTFGPYGAKAIGEPPTVPVAPAIANAVEDATGVRITDLPVTAEKVFTALSKKTG